MRRVAGFVTLTTLLLACAISIDDSLEGKECSRLGQCLPGYECSEDNLCVRVVIGSPQTGVDAAVGASDSGPAAAPTVDAGNCDPSQRCGETCVDLQRDALNCGICGRKCPGGANGRASCRDGACALDCEADYSSCAGGCYRLSDDALHCGDCAFACGIPANGAAVCASGQCAVRCNEGFKACGDRCVRVEVDPANCGACGVACAPDQQCAQGMCVQSCPEGTQVCDRSCVDTATDALHCGRCGASCIAPAGATAACQAGSCSWVCGGALQLCNGACADLQTDIGHCGSCGATCATAPSHGRPACAMGACGAQCDPGYGDCEGFCVEEGLLDNVRNNGFGLQNCATLATFQDLATCNGFGSSLCGSSCIDLASDPAHCGRCERACASGQSCFLGNCVGVGF